MSITEIASTGLLRVIALPAEVAPPAESPDWAARAAALAALQASAGIPGSKLQLRSRTPDRSNRGRARDRGRPGADADYRDRVRDTHHGDDDGDSTFDSLL